MPRDDATALAAALDAALRHGRGLPTEESVRRAHVVAKFSIDAVAQRWLEIYASLIGAAATPRTEAV